MSDYPSLSRIILSSPSQLAPVEGTARQWIQLAKTGSFESKRYGKFGITKDDLKQMLTNFQTVTPKAPTELPIDYDHIGMSPQRPGDGIAAGWMKQLALRNNGDELWAEVEWTAPAAERIRNKEYRYISPSFSKDYVDKTGKAIGCTLLAAAVTNFPFLEGMAALTLYNFSALGDLALDVPAETATTVHLAEMGQKVGFNLDPSVTPELDDEERGLILEVKSVVGDGDDAFLRLTTTDGEDFGWFRSGQTRPAPAENKETTSPLPAKTVQEGPMNNSDTISAARFAERVKEFEATGKSTREAMHLAMKIDGGAAAAAYRRQGIGSAEAPDGPGPVLQLSVLPTADESFESVVGRYLSEHPGVTLKTAIRTVASSRPDLALSR